MGVKRNISIYYWYSTFTNLLILGPVLTLFLLGRGLNFTQIMALQSIAAITITIMEVPTGAVGDLLGRKYSVMLGSLCMFVSTIFYAFGHNFFWFALAEITFSIGMCFKSGSDTALLYDTLKKLDRESDFKKIQGKGHALSLIAQIPGSILAGYAFEINEALPMIISGGFMLIALFIEFFFEEIEVYEFEEKPSYFGQIASSVKYTVNHGKVKALIVYSMFFCIFYRAGFWFFQPYLKAIEIPVVHFGYIFALFNLVAALTSKYSGEIISKTKGKTLLLVVSLILVSFALLGFTNTFVGVIFILPQQMARGLYKPVIMKSLNKNIPSNKRATIISLHSLLSNLAMAITLPLIGMLMDSRDIFSVHIIMAELMFVGILPLSIYLRYRLSKKVVQ
jgi:MFS family permease